MVLPSGSFSHGATSAGFSAKVPKVLPRFSQVVLPLLVARLLDSRLRSPRFSQGSPQVLPSSSPGGTSAGFSAKVPMVLPRFS